MNAFKSIDYKPDEGYWYQDGHGTVRGNSRFEVTLAVEEHFRRSGRPVPLNAFALVMDFMCPRLPDGICVKPSAVVRPTMDTVKANTRKFFGKTVATADVISERLSKCHECPRHNRSFCPGCTGLPDWIARGFGRGRGTLPADLASGVCACDQSLVSGAATPLDQSEFLLGKEAPDGCWRK